MKYVQIIYGYSFILSVAYLIFKMLLLFTKKGAWLFFALFLLLVFIIRIYPHPDNHRSPFAFGLRLFFQRQK